MAASSAEREMNLAALQQRDPYITGIVDSASQVAVYSFNSNLNEWEKTNVEGTLFVYSRSANPVNGFMIINRLHLNDLIEPINRNLEFQLQDPFLLYRNQKAAIYGIWFYDRDECARIGQLMNSLVQVAVETQQKESARQRRASESDTSDTRSSDAAKAIDAVQKNVDILQMLSKAQDEYDKSKAQILRKSTTPTVTTNGNCSVGVGPCSSSPVSKVKGGASSKAGEPSPGLVENPNAGEIKPVKLVRPTAVKPAPLDTSKRAICPDPNMTPNTQISLEALFKRAVLQQDGQSETNSYRIQQPCANMVPTVAQLMFNQTGTKTVEELERQHQGNANRRIEKSRPPAAEAFPDGALSNGHASGSASVFSRLISAEPESPNSMLWRTLNLGPMSTEKSYQSVSQNCLQALGPEYPGTDTSKQWEGVERKASNNTETLSQNRNGFTSQLLNLPTSLSSQKLPSPPEALASAASSTPAAISQAGGSGLGRHGPKNSEILGSFVWSNGPVLQAEALAPPETFQTTALKNDVSNILLSPLVFQTAGLPLMNQVKLPESLHSDSMGGAAVCDRSPLGKYTDAATPSLPVNHLTRDQLQQALIHLLKNDHGFLSAIHEAYVASLNQGLGNRTRP